MASKIRGKCPNCGTKLEVDLKSQVSQETQKAWDSAWDAFHSAFERFDKLFSTLRLK